MVIASASFFHYSDHALFVGKKSEDPTYKIGLLLPVLGVRASVFWKDISLWLVGFLSWFAYARIPAWIQSL